MLVFVEVNGFDNKISFLKIYVNAHLIHHAFHLLSVDFTIVVLVPDPEDVLDLACICILGTNSFSDLS